MNIYEVFPLIINKDNIDKIDEILNRWYFQTDVLTEEVIYEKKRSAKEFLAMGERKLYEFIMETLN